MPPICIRDAEPADRPAILAVTLDAYAEYSAQMPAPAWERYDPDEDNYQSLRLPQPVPHLTFAADHKCDFWDAQVQAAASGR